jgi:hypothetical protein
MRFLMEEFYSIHWTGGPSLRRWFLQGWGFDFRSRAASLFGLAKGRPVPLSDGWPILAPLVLARVGLLTFVLGRAFSALRKGGLCR